VWGLTDPIRAPIVTTQSIRLGNFTLICASLACLSLNPLLAQTEKRGAVTYDERGVFQDNFRSGSLTRWALSEDARYNLATHTPERIAIVDAPGLPAGHKAVRFVVPRAPNSFRAEISLRHEKGFQERWYSERILVPKEWVPEFQSKGNDIVMQWHAIPGNGKATYPNLEISIGGDKWFVRQSFGSGSAPTRLNHELPIKVETGKWSLWIVHAKWSPKEDGVIRIWKDGATVFEKIGPNVYGDIGVEYTPYVKTGIYHPEWNLNTDRKRQAFAQDKPQSFLKTLYVTDFKMGDHRMGLQDMTLDQPAVPDHKE